APHAPRGARGDPQTRASESFRRGARATRHRARGPRGQCAVARAGRCRQPHRANRGERDRAAARESPRPRRDLRAARGRRLDGRRRHPRRRSDRGRGPARCPERRDRRRARARRGHGETAVTPARARSSGAGERAAPAHRPARGRGGDSRGGRRTRAPLSVNGAMAAPYGVYVHVPWCRHVCPYCDFNVHASSAPPEADDLAAYVTELTAWAARPEWDRRAIRTLYLGGGTPSLLSPAAVARLLDAARRLGLQADAEVTLEANPGTVTRDRLAAYRDAGVSRISLGAQSFQTPLLRTLGRDHSADETRAAVAAVRHAGFDNLSLDLIFAVPGQTLEEWIDDLSQDTEIRPEHVSDYTLTCAELRPLL